LKVEPPLESEVRTAYRRYGLAPLQEGPGRYRKIVAHASAWLALTIGRKRSQRAVAMQLPLADVRRE